VAGGETEQTVRSISTTKIMPGWDTNPGSACGGPLSWTPDFAKVLLTATPPKAPPGTSHMVLVDLVTETMVDLSAARQGAGFSGGLPTSDANPGFVADATSRKVTFGHNVVLFTDNFKYKTMDVRSPGKTRPVDNLNSEYATHPEYHLWAHSTAPGGAFNTVSPDGTYLFSAVSATVGRATDLLPLRAPKCAGAPGRGGVFLGWTDATHAVYSEDQFLGLVTVNGTKLSCESLLPVAAGRLISRFQISPDARHVILTTNGPAGAEIYAASTSLPASEPTKLSQAPSLAPGAVLFFPGNY
jgi:hypothetical protein